MLTGARSAAAALDAEPREVNEGDNRQVLEFLQLVADLKRVAALLAIKPADGKSHNSPT